MIDYLHLILFVATVSLVVQATRRSMAGSLSLLAVVCLVGAVVILAVRNKSLNASVESERVISSRFLDEKSRALDACTADLKSKSSAITDLETLRDKNLEDKRNMEAEIDNLKVEVESGKKLTESIESLKADVTTLTETTDRLKSELDAAQQQISTLSDEKSSLEARLGETQQKLQAAEAAAAAAAAAKPPAAPVEPPKEAVKVEAPAA